MCDFFLFVKILLVSGFPGFQILVVRNSEGKLKLKPKILGYGFGHGLGSGIVF